jgi:hypothetical protein
VSEERRVKKFGTCDLIACSLAGLGVRTSGLPAENWKSVKSLRACVAPGLGEWDGTHLDRRERSRSPRGSWECLTICKTTYTK